MAKKKDTKLGWQEELIVALDSYAVLVRQELDCLVENTIPSGWVAPYHDLLEEAEKGLAKAAAKAGWNELSSVLDAPS